MSVQTKRLFVGGLNSGTKEQDIRERFKTFGSVSSVEVHVRPKNDGFPEKTFAYVNINAPDTDIKKCISMLSNTKWKGGILKIQLAKESFLSRLQREREEIKSKVGKKESKSSPSPSEFANAAPNALPGTLIPGKKNWVVGKFGRVLPVVHMRQTGSHKICRIDPSKTVHNLKRIKGDSDEKPVSELTWNLEEQNDNKDIINGVKREDDSEDTDSSSSEDIIMKSNSTPASKKKKKESRANEIENIDESGEMEFFEGKKKDRDSSLKKCFTKKLSDDEEGLENGKIDEGDSRLDDNDNIIKNDCQGNIDSGNEKVKSLASAKSKTKKTKKKRKVSDSSDSDQIDSVPHGSSDDRVIKKKRKSKIEKGDKNTDLEENSLESTENKSILLDSKTDLNITRNDFEKQDDLKTYLHDKIDKKKKKKERKEKRAKDDMESENEAMTNVSKKKKREKKRKQEIKEEVRLVESSDENNDKQQKKPVKRKVENTAKKLASNEKRLRAAKEREASSMSKQSVIASALKNLDNSDGKVKNSKHIKFDEKHEEEEQLVEEKEKKNDGKISGSKASNWLGLDSASDDDEGFADKDVEDHIFAAKPQFEGETGHKLFKLQKSYRGDSRFQLDERFAESDDESEQEDESATRKYSRGDTTHYSDSDVEATNDNDISKQLSREKDLSMSVLRGILGHNIGTKYGDNSSKKDRFTDSSLIRYDPTRDDHAQFEQKPKKQDNKPEPAVEESQQEATNVMRSVPEVTKEKFYDVKTNALTEMFGKSKSDDNSTSFKFLSYQAATEDTEAGGSNWGETEELRSKPWNPVMLPYDSSGDEEENMEHEEQQQNVQTATEESFFFHFGDPDLEKREDDEENLFVRTQSVDQLNEHWIATRSDLTHDYKKKHKDAVKRQSKMAAKRARMR